MNNKLTPDTPKKPQQITPFLRHIKNSWFLFLKELYSVLWGDPILLFLIIYTFSFSIYSVATGAPTEVKNLVIGIVDEDHSILSGQIQDALTPPLFKGIRPIKAQEIDSLMDQGELVFIIEIPPSFEQKILSGHVTSLQINVDATAMMQAGTGTAYLQTVISDVLQKYAEKRGAILPQSALDVRIINKYNPNLRSYWFTSVMQIVNNITMLIMILSGAALIREREQGTIEHLLVMPLVPTEIMISKIVANSFVILVSALLSLKCVVQGVLGVPISGSIFLFITGAAIFAMATAALGIVLGTIASTMGQFGLLAMPVMTLLMLLSGGSTPIESMPMWLQIIMQVCTPTPHFVSFSQAVLFRGAGWSIVWPELFALTAIGIVYFLFSLKRFKRVIFGI